MFKGSFFMRFSSHPQTNEEEKPQNKPEACGFYYKGLRLGLFVDQK